MEVTFHEAIDKDLKKLKKYPAPKESIDAWVRLFQVKGLEGTPSVDRYPGFGSHNIYKARVIALKENVGKSKGYRLIFELSTSSEVVCNILCFSRHGIYKDEQELIAIIKSRL